MGKTRKVRSAGRFGSRYGVGIRKRLLKIEDKQRKYYKCPSCGYEKAKRTAPGIFKCRKCDLVFAGGAYFPVTLPGSIVQKMVTQRSFLPQVKELLAVTEKPVQKSGLAEKSNAVEGVQAGAVKPAKSTALVEKKSGKVKKAKPKKKGK